MHFNELGLAPEIVKALVDKGYSQPTAIQAQAIPAVLSGKDIMAAAQTGTGKTAGFTLPILQSLLNQPVANAVKNNQVKVLILTPTRELAAQVYDNIALYSKHTDITSDVVFGGVKINPQMCRLTKGVDILVATPGRLLDLYQQNAIKFDALKTFVLDEADRMLDMGFIRDIKKIIALLPNRRQNLLFSATFSDDIRQLAKGLVYQPVEISTTPSNAAAPTIDHWLVNVDKKKKTPLLVKLIAENKWQQVLVFCRTKHGANRLTRTLESEGLKAAAIHGNKSQGARTKALANFKDKTIEVLVATDIAARGIDISQLPVVVNFELPNVQEDYVHRIGRTGRAGETGQAISLVSADEYKQLVDVEHVIQQHIERKQVAGFEPHNELEPSRPIRPLKKKKPKKAKKPKTEKVEHKDGQKSEQSRQQVKRGKQSKLVAQKNANGKVSGRRKKPASKVNTGKKGR